MDTKDIKLFEGKNFSDLLKEIYDNSKNKKIQVDLLISDVLAYITDAGSAVEIVPLLKELLDVGVKNDEQLVKLATVVQRLKNAEMKGSSEEFALSEQEKNQLLNSIEDTVQELQDKQDVLGVELDDVTEVKKKRLNN